MRPTSSLPVLGPLACLLLTAGCEPDGAKSDNHDAGQTGGTDWSLYGDTADTAAQGNVDGTGQVDPDGDQGDPYGRDLSCPQPTECISLAESYDRGWATVTWDGTLDVDNDSPYEVCAGRWHTFFSETSQDAIAGHSDISWPGEPEDAWLIEAESRWRHEYARTVGGPAWWCIERTQVTAYGSRYRFTGARAPTPLMTYVHTETDTNSNSIVDQNDYADPSTGAPWTNHNIWDLIAEQPVFVVGRTPNYLELQSGTSAPLTIEVVNLGREAGSIQVSERLPAGTRAWGFSVLPTTSETHGDGSTTHTWYFKMNAAEDDEDTNNPSTYDIVKINYNVEWNRPDCGYREKTWAPEVSWTDNDELRHTSSGTELVLVCCEQG